MVTRQQRLNDFDSEGQPPAGELMELLCDRDSMPGVRAFRSALRALRGDIANPALCRAERLKPTSLAGEGNEEFY